MTEQSIVNTSQQATAALRTAARNGARPATQYKNACVKLISPV